MQLSSLYNIGIDALDAPKASKVKISNIVTIMTCLIASFYGLFFYVQIQAPALALMNLGFVVAYALSMALNYFHLYKQAKLWLFIVLMVHVFVLTVYVFTASASFHFYYLLLPCGVFLLFDDEDEIEKLFVMVTGSALFFYCHIFQNTTPIVTLPKHTEQTIFISAITVIILEIYLVMSIYSRANARHQQELQTLATIDPLTGVNNRRTMITRGEEFYDYAKRYHTVFSLIILDIDHFKKINDTYGHAIGDEILKQVSQTLVKNTRSSDFVARFGGEEFVILLPETDQDAALIIAEQLKHHLSQGETKTAQGIINCTASFGVSSFDGSTQQTTPCTDNNAFSLLLNQADIALYAAKDGGRNQVSVYRG